MAVLLVGVVFATFWHAAAVVPEPREDKYASSNASSSSDWGDALNRSTFKNEHIARLAQQERAFDDHELSLPNAPEERGEAMGTAQPEDIANAEPRSEANAIVDADADSSADTQPPWADAHMRPGRASPALPPAASGVGGSHHDERRTAAGATLCEETCRYSGDSDCDDGGPGADYTTCELGSDCTDCGIREASRRALASCARSWGSCGSQGCCEEETDTCFRQSQWYSQCLPSADGCPAGWDADGCGLCASDDETICYLERYDDLRAAFCPTFPSCSASQFAEARCHYVTYGPRDGRTFNCGLCYEDCSYSGDGDCDDGGPGAEFSSCELGTDCIDCGARAIDPNCNEGCSYSGDGDCDDGGPGADYTSCEFGSDCIDCGTRADMCECTGVGNQISCSLTGVRYCGGAEECFAPPGTSYPFGQWSDLCRQSGRRLQQSSA